jgi:hypothetical protein
MGLHELKTRIQTNRFEKYTLIQDLGVIVSGLSFNTYICIKRERHLSLSLSVCLSLSLSLSLCLSISLSRARSLSPSLSLLPPGFQGLSFMLRIKS